MAKGKNIAHVYAYGDVWNAQIAEASEFGVVSLSGIKAQVEAVKNPSEIHVHIHSYGGQVYEGFAIHDYLVSVAKTTGAKLVTIIEGVCASIATVIFLAGTDRQITQNSRFLIHNPMLSPENATAEELRIYADEMDKEQKKIVDFYVMKTGKDADVLQQFMNDDKMLDAEFALEYGFATEIVDSLKAVASARSISNMRSLKNNNMDKSKIKLLIASLTAATAAVVEKLMPTNEDNAPVAASVKLADGTEIHFEGELTEGTAVFTDAEMTAPVADGEHALEDGRTITVAEGAVSAITEASTDEETDAEKIARLEARVIELESTNTANEELMTEMAASLEDATTALASVKSTWKPEARKTNVPKKAVKAPEDSDDFKARREALKAKLAAK